MFNESVSCVLFADGGSDSKNIQKEALDQSVQQQKDIEFLTFQTLEISVSVMGNQQGVIVK